MKAQENRLPLWAKVIMILMIIVIAPISYFLAVVVIPVLGFITETVYTWKSRLGARS